MTNLKADRYSDLYYSDAVERYAAGDSEAAWDHAIDSAYTMICSGVVDMEPLFWAQYEGIKLGLNRVGKYKKARQAALMMIANGELDRPYTTGPMFEERLNRWIEKARERDTAN